MRKFIDIINEFMSFDPEKFVTTDDGGNLPPVPEKEDGEPRGKKVHVFDILWDTDEPNNLPTEITITLDELDDVTWPSEDGGPDGDMMTRIGDWLTENIHGALSNFDYSII